MYDYIFQSILRNKNFYEVNFLNYFQYLVRQDGAVIDAGANIGNHSLFFSIVMGRETFSFEPNTTAYKALQENLRINQSAAVCFRLGLADAPGNAPIVSDGTEENNIGMAKLGLPTDKPSDVKLTSIDEFLFTHHVAKVAAIKIDVEGYEEKVLRGAKNALRQHRPSVFVEAQDAASFQAIEKIMQAENYQVVHVMGAKPMWHFAPRERYSEIVLGKTWAIRERGVRNIRRFIGKFR